MNFMPICVTECKFQRKVRWKAFVCPKNNNVLISICFSNEFLAELNSAQFNNNTDTCYSGTSLLLLDILFFIICTKKITYAETVVQTGEQSYIL